MSHITLDSWVRRGWATGYLPISAQHSVRQLKQRIRPRGEAPVPLPAERRQMAKTAAECVRAWAHS